MAQAKKTVKAEETEQVKEQPKNGAIIGSQIKFGEAILVSGEQSPQTSARSSQYLIKLLPNGWATIQKPNQEVATYVPAGNILYFIPEK